MDRLNFRIMSKVGLLVVIIGFFMPVSCNLNGFQLAQYASSFEQLNGGMNPLSLGLYGIFSFSCLGVILLLLLVMKIHFSINWDWIAVSGAIISAILVFINTNGGNTSSGGNMFQYGAYVMLVGMIVSLLFLLRASSVGQKNVTKKNTSIPNTHIGNSQKLFCSQCGNKLKQGYSFCSNCGAKI